MTVIITQETAFLVETLARAASVIGSTAASAKINQLIVDILPATAGDESIAEALRQDNIALTNDLNVYRISNEMRGESLEVLRSAMAQITQITNDALEGINTIPAAETLRQIISLSALDPEPELVEA
jgi:hypothetical protein